jgi:hypothetical protein
MAIDISNTTRRIVYTGSAGTGPYAFDFEVLAQTDIAVYFNYTELTLTTDYTVTVDADGTGSITIVTGTGVPTTPDADDRITIVGDRDIERSTDFTTGGPLFATSLNDEFDSQTIFVQQVQEQADRALRAPNTDPTNIDMVLPNNVDRANKTLAFDSDGNPIIGEQIGDWKGDWAASTSYNKRDLVKDTTTDNVYICQVAHTSSGSLPITTNTDSAKWDLVVDAAAANTAKVAAEAAQAAAETAQTAAELAETNAETAETNAETAETNAAASASAASTSETNAATSASSASTSATNASTSETNAASSASAASTSETNAASSASSASTSASSASTSATTATTQASAASTSATNAANSASAASTSESNAATSATNASNAQTAAEAAQAAAEAAADNFEDTYLGAKASDPTLDNDGDPLNAGDLYFNTTTDRMRVYDGAAWNDAVVDTNGVVTKTSATGSAELPSGTEAQRDGSPSAGYLRFNSDSTSFEGYDGSAWGAIGGGGGASAGGAIYENTDDITEDYTITAGSNGFSVGPMTIASGVSVTIPSGQRWVVL